MVLPLSERQLEDILAAHPDEFFPDRQVRLVGRQTSLAGIGRFDLLFEDRAGRNWLIELKAVPLKITDTDQVLRYHEELLQRGAVGLIPCFVAPVIPPHVRSYLDAKGIEHREFTLAEFRRVAATYDLPSEQGDAAGGSEDQTMAAGDQPKGGSSRGGRTIYHAGDFSPSIVDGERATHLWKKKPGGPGYLRFVFHVDSKTKQVAISSPDDSTDGERHYLRWRELIVGELGMETWRQPTSVLNVKRRHERRRDERIRSGVQPAADAAT